MTLGERGGQVATGFTRREICMEERDIFQFELSEFNFGINI